MNQDEKDEIITAMNDGYYKMYKAMANLLDLHCQGEENTKELQALSESLQESQKKVEELQDTLAKNNRDFLKCIARETAKIGKERDDAVAQRDEAVREMEMWKKSYEDLVKCV